LELIEKTILSTMYVCQINEKNPTDIIKKKCMLPDNQFNDKIKELMKKNW